MIKYGLDQNNQVYLGWELGADEHEVTCFMQWHDLEILWANWSLVKWIFYMRSGSHQLKDATG